jgi:cation:H+ antiporter
MIAGAAMFPLQWLIVHFSGIPLAPQWEALSSGLSIFGAAFMPRGAPNSRNWTFPRRWRFAFLALIAVLPEYAVDIYFAWQAGKNPAYTAYATANMTGANRLLIGVGWAAVMIAFWLKSGTREMSLGRDRRLEVVSLLVATCYSFLLPLKGTLSILDAAVFLVIFTFYMIAASQAHLVEPELEGPPETLAQFGAAGAFLRCYFLRIQVSPFYRG